MIRLLFILAFGYSFCEQFDYFTAKKSEINAANTRCPQPINQHFSVNSLRATMVNGEWHYQYSFFNDTCTVIDDLADVPKVVGYFYKEDRLVTKDTTILSSRSKDLLKDISSYVIDKTGKHKMIVCCSMKINNHDSLISRVMVYHRSVANDRLTREYSYCIGSISNDTMIIESGRHFGIHDSDPFQVKHVFVRRKTNAN